MRAALILVALATAAAPSRAECLSNADASAAVKKASAANESSFAKELAKKKLTKITLPRHRPHERGEPRLNVGDVTTLDSVRVVYLGSFQECTINDAEFVQQGTKVYELERQPKYGPTHIEACECHFTSYRCGGAVPPRVALYYELPTDTTYDGTMPVAYDARDATVQNAGDWRQLLLPAGDNYSCRSDGWFTRGGSRWGSCRRGVM